jgi:hypothetical protein
MKLSIIQSEIKAPKGQFNKFGNYKYRSCEDIVEAAKVVLSKHGFWLILKDEIVNVGNRFYIRATAEIGDGSEFYSSVAYAREEETKKGMDGAQITGAASSYARKYALNGLFAIDDTKDADATNKHDGDEKMDDVPEESERQLLRNLVYSSDLTSEEKEAAMTSIDFCPDYKMYEKIQQRLEARQQSIESMVNPSQKDINKHLRKTVKA